MLLVLVGLFSNNGPPSPPSPYTAREAENLARLKQQQDVVNFERGQVVVMALSLKNGLRNPDSFVLENIVYMDDKAICAHYRAQNGFGGINREAAVSPPDHTYIKTESMGGFKTLWNKYCAGANKHGEDLTSAINRAMKNM